jgi:hypothetical protein
MLKHLDGGYAGFPLPDEVNVLLQKLSAGHDLDCFVDEMRPFDLVSSSPGDGRAYKIGYCGLISFFDSTAAMDLEMNSPADRHPQPIPTKSPIMQVQKTAHGPPKSARMACANPYEISNHQSKVGTVLRRSKRIAALKSPSHLS